MTFEVQILGYGAAAPTLRHMPTSQLVNVHDKMFLVDCGEGTQVQIRKYRIKFQKIDHIFISHLHGDHFFGLIGLLSSMHLLGRTKDLTLFAPKGLQKILETQFEASETRLKFQLIYIDSKTNQRKLLFEDKTLEIYGFPMKHRIPTTGFLFIEKPRKAKIRKSFIKAYNLCIEEMVQIKNRKDVHRSNGDVISWEECTFDLEQIKSYAYCSDTAPCESVRENAKGVSLLYHEATFHSSLKDRAKSTFHTTSEDAGKIAQEAEVGKLVIGHFSSRYIDENILLNEARTYFDQTELAFEGMKLVITDKANAVRSEDMNT
jgi:ribonuclease Z